MAAKMVSLRLPEELLAWATAYAEERGVSRTDLLVEGLRSFREDCERGVPEIRATVARQSSVKTGRGVGQCPKREEGYGHVWKSWKVDPFKSCEFCGMHGREPAQGAVPGYTGPQGGGYFAQVTAERAALFARLKAPMQNGTGDPKKAAK